MAGKEIDLDEKAFPFYAPPTNPGNPGMTLYDYYLGQAVLAVSNMEFDSRYTPEEIACRSDQLAMALLTIRKTRNERANGNTL